MLTGFNHMTFAVSDLQHSTCFYQKLLGCDLRLSWHGGCYLSAGAAWICLVQQSGPVHPVSDNYTHFAFDVAPGAFDKLVAKLAKETEIWQENSSEGASYYFLDPDGHKLELHVGNLESRIDHYRKHPMPGMVIYE